MRVLVTWGSKRGGTAGIGQIIGEELKTHGFEVVTAAADTVRDLDRYDAVIIGGALYANRWPYDVRRFVNRHVAELRKRPVWFFSSGPLDDSAEHVEIPAPPQVAVLAERIGARGHITFGGRLTPDAQGFPASAMAKNRHGDYRNPDRIRAWTVKLAAQLPSATPGTTNSTTTKLADGTTATENQRSRVVGYIRVSTEGQAQEGVSLSAQRAKLEAYAMALDLDLVEIIADEGLSAKSLERRGLQRALSLLNQGKAEALLIVKLDRLTRSVKDLGILLERYFVHGRYSLLSVSDSIDTRSPSGRLVLNVLGSVAQWEREAVIERTKEAMAEIKAQGYPLGSPVYGYRHGQELDAHGRRVVEPDPAQQAGLGRILTLFDSGLSVAKIVATLNAERIPKGRDTPWHRVMLYSILKRAGRLPAVIRPGKSRKPIELVRERESVSAQARKLRGEGLSLRQIGKRLAATGYGPPRGNRWHASTIAAILDDQQAA